jgi:hypothetical protein
MRRKDVNSFAVVCGMPTLKTALRIKPVSNRSSNSSRRRAVALPRQGHCGSYCIDVILGETATQQQTYDSVAAPLVDTFLQVMRQLHPEAGGLQICCTQLTILGMMAVACNAGRERSAAGIWSFTNWQELHPTGENVPHLWT